MDGSPVGHDLQRIHKQIHQHTTNATSIQSDDQAFGYSPDDVYGLKFRTDRNLVHGAADQLTNI
ncbi:MAG TPA: hypothetical protein VLE22_26450 [Bryobacteraceae bacterium]|nr:hypothetical protein [Bryobacteraceae bacterium]